MRWIIGSLSGLVVFVALGGAACMLALYLFIHVMDPCTSSVENAHAQGYTCAGDGVPADPSKR